MKKNTEILDLIKQFKEKHSSEWFVVLSLLGALSCALFGKIAEVPLFPCAMITILWFGLSRIKGKSKFESIAFFLGALIVQIMKWLSSAPIDML